MSSTKYLNKELNSFNLSIDYKLLFNDIKHLTKSTSIQPPSVNNEWFELLDKVIDQLKSSSNSFAFRKPVRKFEAPDYHMVITRPMDLSTISRKIKQRQYKNKQQFKVDLDLIWNNCLVYNTDPNHPLRSHAIHLQTKSSQLLEFIPDSPNSLLQDDDVSTNRSVTPSQNTHKRPHKKRKLDSNAVIRSVSPTNSPTPFHSTILSNPFSDSLAIIRTNDMINVGKEDEHAGEGIQQGDQPWKLFFDDVEQTKEEKVQKEEEQSKDDIKNEDTPSDRSQHTLINSASFQNTIRNRLPRAPSPHTYSTPFVVPPHTPSTLQTTFNTHLNTLTQLHQQYHTSDKESDDMDIDDSESGTQDGEEDEQGDYKWGTSLFSTYHNQLGTMDDGVTTSVLRKVTMATLAHSGFTSSNALPVELLTHLLHTYLQRLCESLKHASEFYADSLGPCGVIAHALTQNGSSVDMLQDFVDDDLGDAFTERIRSTIDNGDMSFVDFDTSVEDNDEKVDKRDSGETGESENMTENSDKEDIDG